MGFGEIEEELSPAEADLECERCLSSVEELLIQRSFGRSYAEGVAVDAVARRAPTSRTC